MVPLLLHPRLRGPRFLTQLPRGCCRRTGREAGCRWCPCHREQQYWRLVLSSAGRGCRLWHHPSPLGKKSVGLRVWETPRASRLWKRELGIPRDSPEALKDCSTRPTFTTCKEKPENTQHEQDCALHLSPQSLLAPQLTHPHKGDKLLAGVLVGAAEGRESGQGLGVLSTDCCVTADLVPRQPCTAGVTAGSHPLGPSPLPSLP